MAHLEQPHLHDLLRLSLVVGVSPRVQACLVARFGTAGAVFEAPAAEVLAFAGPEVAKALTRGPVPPLVERTLRWAERPGHHLIALESGTYPAALREISDPPLVLYAQGRVDLLGSSCFAIVGARNATFQGKEDAQTFARALSDAGLCIVSGLAHGVDAAAHRGGLAGLSSSIAVMGTGSDIVYPTLNHALAHQLVEEGCVLTEFCLGTPPVPGNFPRRNRLISGLARGVLVVEANDRSGSLVTARLAADQGRDVFAIPGSIHSSLSKGCHRLIKDGAMLVETSDDILRELGLQPVAPPPGARPPSSHPLLGAMGFDPVSVDQITQRTGMAAGMVIAQLSLLEIDGSVAALPGGRFQRVGGAA